MKKQFEDLTSQVASKVRWTKDMLEEWSDKRLILIIVLIWALLYIPMSVSNSVGDMDRHYAYYPEGAGPGEITYKEYNVSTSPVPISNASGDHLSLEVQKGQTVEFNWTAEGYDSPKHIGRINVYYEMDGKEGLIRLKKIAEKGGETSWAGEHRFERGGNVSYHYRLDKNDISIFHRRASVIVEGGNLYEDVHTGPPPLINFFFVIPTLLTPAVSVGGAYLSFQLYFSLFILIDTLVLYFGFKHIRKPEAFLAGILFMINPVTLSNIHQDEPIVAFMILLPVYFIVRERERMSSLIAGLSVPVKIWGLFLYPLYLLRDDRDIKKGISLIVTALSISLSIFLFFYLLWGEKSVWFLSRYSGQTGGLGLGPVSFWGRWMIVFPGLSGMISEKLIFVLIGLAELITFCTAYKKGWTRTASITAFLSIFFALYLKVHWDYFIILFPFLALFAARDVRSFALYIGLTAVLESMMILASASFGIGDVGMALLATLVTAILLSNVYLFFTSSELHDAWRGDDG